jgi:hypothetical protein
LRPPATGADDKQADCVARLAPLLAAFAGDEQLFLCVEAATRVTQVRAAESGRLLAGLPAAAACSYNCYAAAAASHAQPFAYATPCRIMTMRSPGRWLVPGC